MHATSLQNKKNLPRTKGGAVVVDTDDLGKSRKIIIETNVIHLAGIEVGRNSTKIDKAGANVGAGKDGDVMPIGVGKSSGLTTIDIDGGGTKAGGSNGASRNSDIGASGKLKKVLSGGIGFNPERNSGDSVANVTSRNIIVGTIEIESVVKFAGGIGGGGVAGTKDSSVANTTPVVSSRAGVFVHFPPTNWFAVVVVIDNLSGCASIVVDFDIVDFAFIKMGRVAEMT